MSNFKMKNKSTNPCHEIVAGLSDLKKQDFLNAIDASGGSWLQFHPQPCRTISNIYPMGYAAIEGNEITDRITKPGADCKIVVMFQQAELWSILAVLVDHNFRWMPIKVLSALNGFHTASKIIPTHEELRDGIDKEVSGYPKRPLTMGDLELIKENIKTSSL